MVSRSTVAGTDGITISSQSFVLTLPQPEIFPTIPDCVSSTVVDPPSKLAVASPPKRKRLSTALCCAVILSPWNFRPASVKTDEPTGRVPELTTGENPFAPPTSLLAPSRRTPPPSRAAKPRSPCSSTREVSVLFCPSGNVSCSLVGLKLVPASIFEVSAWFEGIAKPEPFKSANGTSPTLPENRSRNPDPSIAETLPFVENLSA